MLRALLLTAPCLVSGDEASFDHSRLDRLLRRHVSASGGVDYRALRDERKELDLYIESLASAPLDELGRDEKLALLVNAYNAFTLRLVVEHYPIESIQDIPPPKRWDDVRWRVVGKTLSLNQLEHEEIRPKFREPRVHFALVCAAIGCPPLRSEAYTGERLERQLEDQTRRAHADERWFRLEPGGESVRLTRLYEWYAGDFEQAAGSVLDFAGRYSPELAKLLGAQMRPRVQWIEYDWRLNEMVNAR
jgi:hypothetical protein